MLKILILVALLKVLTTTHKPSWCAGLYGALSLLLGLVFAGFGGMAFSHIVVGVLIETAIVFVFFCVLEKLDGSILWWVVAALGIGGFVFIGFAGLLPLTQS